MKHIATGRALSLGENYSLLMMGDSNGDGDGGGVDGDGPGGNTPSRQGAGIELLSPETCLRWRRRSGNLLGKRLRY